MCGIFGYIGWQEAAPLILQGLRQLEYRGYDSAGLAVLERSGAVQVRREAGKLINLEHSVAATPVSGTVGVGHTRWATHGPPIQRNAHPHSSPDGDLVVVQNGIVENFLELRQELESVGYHFRSDTDTEVIAHLIHRYYHHSGADDLEQAIRKAMQRLKGPSAIVMLSSRHPDRLIAVRLGNAGGVAVGYGEGEMFVASDIPAILPHTRQMAFLDNRQMAIVTAQGAVFKDLEGRPVHKECVRIDWNPTAAEKGEFRHFMQKEIFEQGRSLTDTLRGRLDFRRHTVLLDSLNLDTAQVQRLSKITIVACGTSYYAGMVGKYYIERLARIPVEVDYASEFRYRDPLVGPDQMVLAITQSGETVDTLAALEEARTQGAFTAAIVNAIGSQAARVTDGHLLMQAGPEIGVASTKAFTASIADLLLLAVYLGERRGVLPEAQRSHIIRALSTLPGLAGELLEEALQSERYRELAERYHTYHNFLYLGRNIHYPIAREGALKLKEISYIHAEGYPAGEMKHGPIALIDATMPTVVLAPRDHVYDKMLSQIEQIKARSGPVLAVVHADDEAIHAKVDAVMPIPASDALLTPILAVMPLQIFAYEMAVRRGADVDQPRNLAKSVTVE
ncbi:MULTISPECIES: glutamine--fructose-6-phosphate transaminase (isomerizing) [Caldilinea]|jgi:glucosamine--fructose-6-phosphate aminotransferase (isomerizing)|uniref:Glutamine--fructose-6-phosphate aminotransferase [isomerizing] n=1 Tax=Caldilinea aerophila (strain DSM 14535 / JCM 11387 / NBRC 104270 / STL-6-O1) TaxID=926550 RepID=I0I2J1_CALAS|nr:MULTISPECIES: glutamine--fructose-6-phosphate transaminase (isomerizing) [Caldilinea]MBO9391984.1 glutamine--fructose-6-phosphate transaminase (isomerizing) [Caldilinea sp.]BAL99478.1 glucosamine--fructose-6-phosphate aminotransferase [Caldilinea aerophila DSM 14535 = NBRC 104270]GIV73926.1 MAG: glutamine--fructose-6-phosphate aminotransferase [isomerizing] [Caldilinea sp.]